MDEGTDPTIQSVDITCSVIEALRTNGRMGISELADDLDYAKSTVYNHLSTLEANQFVVREDDAFRLSLHFLELAHDVKQQYGLMHYSIIREKVDELASETGEYAQFGSEEYGEVIYMYRSRESSDINDHFQLDIKEPIHCTATGKAMLAFMPQERVDEIVETHGLAPQTANTITDDDDLREELSRIREQGYAVDDEEFATGLRCVAAPVVENRRYRGVVIGSIGILGPVSRLTDDRLAELSTEVKRFANLIEIACNLG